MTLRKFTIGLVAFGNGAVIMAYEIFGARTLQPDFGSSIFVWGSLIGVFMTSLSVGYFLGGIMADRTKSFGILAANLAAPGALLLLFPLYGPCWSAWVFDRNLGERLGPLVASALIFLLPTALMGTVSTYVIRLFVSDLAKAGRAVGSVSGLATLGSILGTFAATFYLVGVMGTRSAVMTLGAVEAALAALALGVARAVGRTVAADEAARRL